MSQRIFPIFFLFLISLFAFNVEAQPNNQLIQRATYLDAFEKQVLIELNKVRANPAQYAEENLEPLLKAFDGRLFIWPGTIPIKTQEGEKALIECIRVMKKQKPLPLLSPSEGLSKAANILVKEQQKTGAIGHTGRRGSNPQTRVEQLGDWEGRLAENITYGNNSPFRVVVNLLIDDGVPSRNHRRNILDTAFRTIGIAAGEHPKYSKMCVMEMAGGFQSK
ncbi:CAP domain-containing protein [uncultured Sunxiuqinia sp.]|uniref:CAP domain-containing protein n=1 Tax=uncultured Sunxiuqinia sp. TaxID=1573825 RepID=UPI002AA68810|nr:CAP domain-containing protein [uncultured Sunxiuqinia sp.]